MAKREERNQFFYVHRPNNSRIFAIIRRHRRMLSSLKNFTGYILILLKVGK